MPSGGKREGAGRPKGSRNKNSTGRVTATKSVTLSVADWKILSDLGADNEPPMSPQKYAQSVLVEHIGNQKLLGYVTD